MLAQPSGPKTVLRILYEDGAALEFLKLLKSIEGNASNAARNFNDLVNDKFSDLQRLDNHDNRYFHGILCTKTGEFFKKPSRVKLTAEGKMQLLLHGTGPLETALRNVVAKPWIERLVLMESKEKQLRTGYNDALADERALSTHKYHCQLQTMIADGKPKGSAISTLRGAQVKTNKAILPDFKSATDAALCAEGKLSEADAILCKQGREDKLSMPAHEMKSLRKTVACVSNKGTRVYHIASEFIRHEATRLILKGVDPSKAYSIIQKQHVDSQKWVALDEFDNPEPPAVQADIYLNKKYDFQQFRKEQQMQDAIPPAGAGAPPPAPLAIPQEDAGSSSRHGKRRLAPGGKEDALDDFDDASSSTSSSTSSIDLSPSLLRTKKKQRRQSTSSKAGGNIPPRPMVGRDGVEKFEIRRISDSRTYKGRHEFWVEWTGYDQSDNCWLPRDVLLADVPETLAAYEANPSSFKARASAPKRGTKGSLPVAAGPNVRAGKISASGGSASKAPSGGAASHATDKEEEGLWSPKLVVIKDEWLSNVKSGEPSFNDITKYLNSDDGIAWRQHWNVFKVATAKELLEW